MDGASHRSVLALISARGGGDGPPVLALAAGLRERGHRVRVLCDDGTRAAVGAAGLEALCLPPDLAQGGYFARAQAAAPGAPYPLAEWARACSPVARAALDGAVPDVVVSSLFCLPLGARLAAELGRPWVFVNPAFYFGDGSPRAWEEDFAEPALSFIRDHLQPLARGATLVLHAADRQTDFPPACLPARHHYVGFLLREPPGPTPAFLDEPGPPWALVSLSTVPQPGDLAIARGALRALAHAPVRVLVTLSAEHDRDALGGLPANARLAGHVPHGRVLPACQLVVSHAGQGIVAKALAHGVPQVLVPWGRDQPGVAARAAATGAAEVVARADCTDARMAAAVARVLAEPRYRQAARAVAARLRADDPVAAACHHVERL